MEVNRRFHGRKLRFTANKFGKIERNRNQYSLANVSKSKNVLTETEVKTFESNQLF